MNQERRPTSAGMPLPSSRRLKSCRDLSRATEESPDGRRRIRSMSATEAAFVSLLFLGILALVAGVTLTRLHWRQEIPPYGRRIRFLDVTLHPEAYVREDAPLRAIRRLNLTGALLLAGAAVVVAYELVQTMLRR